MPISDFLDMHKSESEENILKAATNIRFEEWQDVLKPEFEDKFSIDPSDTKKVFGKALEQSWKRYLNNPEGQIIAHIPKYGVVGSIFSLVVNSKTKDFSDQIFRNYDDVTDKKIISKRTKKKGTPWSAPKSAQVS